MKQRSLMLLAAVALLVGVLAPPAFAGGENGNGIHYDICDGILLNTANPAHVVYGSGAGNLIVDGLMVVDVSDAPGPVVVFWNGLMPFGATGANILGSAFGDTICGTTGADMISGAKGDDRIFGYGGTDTLLGKAGDDVLVNGGWNTGPGGAAATIKGGSGDDAIYGGMGADHLFGNGGDDLIMARGGLGALVVGNAGADELHAGALEGATLIGKGGNDELFSSNVIAGGNNRLFGKKGDDILHAAGQGDDLYGVPGDDLIDEMGSHLDQQAWGGSGNDTILPAYNTSVTPAVPAGLPFWADGNDGDDFIQGSDFEGDPCNGKDQFDTLLGGRGNDEIHGLGGCDHLIGNAGNDLIFGGDDDDVIEGVTDDDVLHGDDGDDRVYGGTGNDRIFGGLGADTLWGGTDTDGDGIPGDADDTDCAPPDAHGGPGQCDLPLAFDGDDYIEGGPGSDRVDVGSGSNVVYGNAPDPIYGLDTADFSFDWFYGWSMAASGESNTYYGHCSGRSGDDAWEYFGAGVGGVDSAYSVRIHDNIENVVTPCAPPA